MTIQDWGVTYEDLEPHYDRFEKLCGTSGRAGNLRGTRIEGGNVWEGPRANEYPNKPLIMSQAGVIFTKATQGAGLPSVPDAGFEFQCALRQSPKGSPSANANIAATASCSAARPTPRRARMSASCRC